MKHDEKCCPECGKPLYCSPGPDGNFYDRREHCGCCGSAVAGPEMAKLPPDAVQAGATPEMDQTSLLAPMRGFHMTPRGRFARLVVAQGALRIEWKESATSSRAEPGRPVVIPPECYHRVLLDGPVRFHVEFFLVPGWQERSDEKAVRPGEPFAR